MDKGCYTGAIYMDLKKAFDTMHHGCLLKKLPMYSIKQTELEWFTDYLFNRSQYVKVDDGPLLFIILINDLYLQLNQCHILLSADDAVLYISHKNVFVIQEVLNREADYVAKLVYRKLSNFKSQKRKN